MEETFKCKECNGVFNIGERYVCTKCGKYICYHCACDLGRTGGDTTVCSDCENENK